MTAQFLRAVPSPVAGVRASRLDRSGFTLVELALLLSLVGVTLAVMVPAFAREVRVSKLAEASEQLDALHRAVASYYATPRRTASGPRIACIPRPAGPTPAEPSSRPAHVDFHGADVAGAITWRAIGFQPDCPIRYRYTLLADSPGCGGERSAEPREVAVRLRAEGDLDGDGRTSRFELALVPRDGVLVRAQPALVVDRVE